MSKNFLPKKYFKIIQLIFIFSCLINLVNSTYTEESMKPTLIFGLGVGTFVVILFVGIGALICIIGLAFPNPGLFVFIGIALPFIVFIFVAFCPKESISKEEDSADNKAVNYYIIARVTHFVIMLLLFLGLLAPAFILWGTQIIPQRVDSSSQRDLIDDNYLEAIEKQKKRKYNMEETDALIPQRLPLGINKRNRGSGLKRNNISIQNNSLIQNTSQNNISNNLIDKTNVENTENNNNNEFPTPILPRATHKNELNENRKKFTGFIRRKEPK